MRCVTLTIQMVDIRSKCYGLEKIAEGYGVYANGTYIGKVTRWNGSQMWEVSFRKKDERLYKKTKLAAVKTLVDTALRLLDEGDGQWPES